MGNFEPSSAVQAQKRTGHGTSRLARPDELVLGARYRRCRGIWAVHASAWDSGVGGESSSRTLEPHRLIVYSGASRSTGVVM